MYGQVCFKNWNLSTAYGGSYHKQTVTSITGHVSSAAVLYMLSFVCPNLKHHFLKLTDPL